MSSTSKTPKHFSQSGFKDALVCFHKYALKRIDGLKSHDDPFSFPRETGTAFDAYVKSLILHPSDLKGVYRATGPVEEIEKKRKETVDSLLKNFTTADHHRARAFGKRLAEAYEKCGALSALKAEGIMPGPEIVVPRLASNGYVIPINAKLDGMVAPAYPLDWKVSGAGGKGASPKQGYFRRWIFQKGTWRREGPHAKVELPMEQVERDWAIQLCVYYWALYGLEVTDEMYGRIEMCAVRPTSFQFASYENRVSVTFQQQMLELFERYWKMIKDGTRPIPVYGWYCEKWNRPCEVSSYCSAWQEEMVARKTRSEEPQTGNVIISAGDAFEKINKLW